MLGSQSPNSASNKKTTPAEIINTETYLVDAGYLKSLFKWTGFWMALIISLILIVDPYGVSPINLSIPRLNQHKPMRLDIDRLIKPYEVWRYQPKTIFLGTSRIHQSIEPSMLKNTKYSPAYNAAVPASTLSQNVANLTEYFKLDKNIKYVFIELFIYNFIFPQPQAPERTLKELILTSTSLTFSTDALISTLKTIAYNRSGSTGEAYIGPDGNWIRPESFSTEATFNQDLYINNIMGIHQTIPDMIIQPTAIESLDKIIALCKEHHAKLYMFITPSYPWDDYRLLSLGYWPLLEEWIKKMSTYDNVFSFSQYNRLLEETAGKDMKWWNDPIHFSKYMGRLMLSSFQGKHNSDIPENLLRKVTKTSYKNVIQERSKGLNEWIKSNQDFTKSFDTAKKAAGNVERRKPKAQDS